MSADRDSRCGTTTGYKAHQRAEEKPCDACAKAKADFDVRWRSAPEITRRNRLHARAQSRASTELRRRHKAEYDVLYRRCKAELEDEMGHDSEESAA